MKPENVFIVSDAAVPGGERTKVLDFGIAKIGAENRRPDDAMLTGYRAILGTPPYMSPEQCRGAGQVAAESDVYSFGVMLYEMMSGRTPFSGDDAISLMSQHLLQPPPPLRGVAAEVPAPVAELVHEMLLKSAADRPTMPAVQQRLGQLLQRFGGAASDWTAPSEPAVPILDNVPALPNLPPPAPPSPRSQQPAQPESPETLFRSQSPGYIWKDGREPGPENIDRLLVCIPIFEDKSRTFYEIDPHGQGFRFGPEAYRLAQVAVEQGLVCESNAIDWLSTKAAIYRNPDAIDTADLYTCQRLLTAFVDDDPQRAIKLPEALDGGLLLRVLWRLRTIRDEMLLGQRRIREEGRIQLLLGDLTNMGVDAIVASSDEHLGGGGRFERYLRERGGPDFVAACQRMGSCPVGEARAINGYRLPAGVVLFTVGPEWRGGTRAEDAALVRCYDSCLELAANTDLHTVAFPAISTGFNGFPPERAARLAIAAVRRYFANNPDSSVWKVYFALYDDAMFRHYEAALRAPPEPLPVEVPALPESPTIQAAPVRPSADGRRDAAAVEPHAHVKAPAATITLPNPEARPVGTFLTHELLINCLFSQVTLEAFRFSRALLNDAGSQLSDLDQLTGEWLTAHDSGPAAELAQLARWSEGKLQGPKLLEELCDRMAVLAHGALGWQQPSCLYGFRVFLRALRDAYVLQAKLFGLDAKLAKGKGTAGTPHKPRPRELPDAWAFVYLGTIVSHRSARVLADELISYPASASVRPLSAGDPALHLRIARNLSIGTSTLAGSGEDFFLITGYLSSLDRYYQLRVHTGTTEMVPRERWSSGSLPLDYVLLDDIDANLDVAKFDLSPADPEVITR